MLVAVVLLACVMIAEGQQTAKVPMIAYLSNTGRDQSARVEAFRKGLRDLGYMEGKNIVVEYRYNIEIDRLPELAAELVSLNVAVIVVPNSATARAVKQVTSKIPIVMESGGNVFGDGLAQSLARPGGNVTGLTNVETDLGVKRLELLKESFPKVTRVAVLASIVGGSGVVLKEMQDAAPHLKMQLHFMKVGIADEFEKAFDAARNAGAAALATTPDSTGLFGRSRKQIVELAVKKQLPAIYSSSQFVDAGGLMSYSANQLDNARRAATYVDKILKGRKPEDLPIEQPMKFEFVVNLQAAKRIGVTIPPNVVVRADRVIK